MRGRLIRTRFQPEVIDRLDASLRAPRLADGRAIWKLVSETPALDTNSPYAYLLVCSHFADTSVVALEGERLVGFLAGYRPPTGSDAIFVWQIGVAPEARGRGLGARMLDHVVEAPACRGIRYLEATITPSNAASRRLFSGFAARRRTGFREQPRFPGEHFPGSAHEPEILVRVGPLRAPRSSKEGDS